MSDDLRARVEDALHRELSAPVSVQTLERLAGGACQDNYRVDAKVASGPLAGDRRFVLRADARQSLPGSLSRREEHAFICAARRAGVKTPEARGLTSGLTRDGAWAYFLDWAEGEAVGRRVVRNPELAQAREHLAAELAHELAALHTIAAEREPSLDAQAMGSTGPDAAVNAVTFARGMLDRLPEPHPALELALRWLEENAPSAVPLRLTHGDFRVGNFLVAPSGLTAVLDWEFAHFGDPMEDLGWLCMRDWRFGQLDKPVGGFAKRPALYDAYAKETGQPVDPRRVHYWEVMSNVRWALGSLYQGERYLSGEETDLELIAVAKRAVEMEYEALRLIERGS